MATDAPSTSLLRPLAEDLKARREQIKLGGGQEKIDAQHAREKLTARERLERIDGRQASRLPPFRRVLT